MILRTHMSFSQETLYAIALTRISYFNTATCLQLYRKLGSATAIMENRNNIKDVISDASPRLINALSDVSEALHRAEAELEFDNAHAIRPLTMACDDYPERMRNCDDAPIVLFYRGNADLNQRRIVSVVGTRHCTAYGQDIINNFCRSLKELCPDVLIVSGLAYGVDFCAHRNALKNGFDTVGVLAHGLDMLYPSAHRDTAKEMLSHGGLLTEFFYEHKPRQDELRETQPHRSRHFRRHNRGGECGTRRQSDNSRHRTKLRPRRFHLSRQCEFAIQRRLQQTHTRQQGSLDNLRRRLCKRNGMGAGQQSEGSSG